MIGIRDALRNLFSSSYVESNMPSQESEAGMSTPSHQIVEVQVSKVCNLQHNISECFRDGTPLWQLASCVSAIRPQTQTKALRLKR